MKLRASDLGRSVVLLAAVWSAYVVFSWATDTGEIAAEFRRAMHNPYRDETKGILDKHMPPQATADIVEIKMRGSRFACSSSTLIGATVMICERSGNGGEFSVLCERWWRAEFLFDGIFPPQAKLVKMRAEARGEC
jgi:hypothetical protein